MQLIEELRKSGSLGTVREIAKLVCSKLVAGSGSIIAHAIDHFDEITDEVHKTKIQRLLEIAAANKNLLAEAIKIPAQDTKDSIMLTASINKEALDKICTTVSQIDGLVDFFNHQPATWDKIDAQLRLKQIRIRNFRRIADMDIHISPETQVICFIGPNGGGKSSLMSLLIHALCDLTDESSPDISKKPLSDLEIGQHRRSWSNSEAGSEGPAFAVQMGWESRLGQYSYHVLIYPPEQSNHEYVKKLRQELNVPPSNKWVYAHWNHRPASNNDLIARSVFLIRPSDRFETPHYEEPPDFTLKPTCATNWEGHRLLPVCVKSGLSQLESFILDVVLDSGVLRADYPEACLQKLIKALQVLTDDAQRFLVSPWPFRRVGCGTLRALSLLSAGELDILVTVGNIVAQQVYLRHKFDLHGDDRGMPSGWVFIDEIDAHLHPQWQQKVVPLLADLFPTIHFVIATHSPFVLRSLPKNKSLVVRLPDGIVFNDDFSAWNIEEILKVIFEVPSRWSTEVEQQLQSLETAARSPEQHEQAVEIYRKLAERSNSLRARCDKIIAVYGDITLRDRIHNLESVKPQ